MAFMAPRNSSTKGLSADRSSEVRKAGLRKLVLARRWLVAGSVTLTGALAALAANAFPGKTPKPVPGPSVSESSTGSSGQSAENSEGSSAPVTPPAQAPQTGEAQEPAPAEQSEAPQSAPEAPIVSGGS